MKKFFVIALGGSLIAPMPGKINAAFLKKFRKLILGFTKRGAGFIIVAGGGKLARIYQSGAAKIVDLRSEDADWLGIHATRINAQLLKTIFRKEAYPLVIDNPREPLPRGVKKYKIIIASGWKPGRSTDYIAVLLAKKFKVKTILDAGNITYVFTKDHKKYKGAQPIRFMSWKNYQKLVGRRWVPGMSSPIDPIAAKMARKTNISAVVFNGRAFKNFKNILQGKKIKGTVISNAIE